MIKYHEIDKTERNKKVNWSIMGVIKQLIGFIIFITILKSIVFPTQSEIQYSEDDQFLNRVDIQLNRSEYIYLESIKLETERIKALNEMKRLRIR